MKRKTQGFWLRLLCWILAGVMVLSVATTVIWAILGIF